MAGRNKKPNRRVIYCLLCNKPQNAITIHLARVCMKNKTVEERQTELQRAKESMTAWTWRGRKWDYNEMCHLWPHKPSRLALLEHLLKLGFLVTNAPNSADLELLLAEVAESPPRPSGQQRVGATEEGPIPGSCKQELRCIPPGGDDGSVMEDLQRQCDAYIEFLDTIKKELEEELIEEECKVSSTEKSGDRRTRAQKRSPEAYKADRERLYLNFLKTFPVTLAGRPPNKKQRVQAGFSQDLLFHGMWKIEQYEKKEQHLLSKCIRSPPAPKKVLIDIYKEGWDANNPYPEEIVAKWRPAPKANVETNQQIMKMITKQKWSGLSVRELQGDKGYGVFATKSFPCGSILCDYHGEVITAAEGKKMQEAVQDQRSYLFFFSSGSQKLCIDAQTFPCQCHPDRETIGRTIRHSRKKQNAKPLHCMMKFAEGERHIILFKAVKDISIDEEIRFDHGHDRKSCQGEGLDLEWLDD